MKKLIYLIFLTIVLVSSFACKPVAQSWKLKVFECDQKSSHVEVAACKRLQREGGRYQSQYAKKLIFQDADSFKQNHNKSIREQVEYYMAKADQQAMSGEQHEAVKSYQQVLKVDQSATEPYLKLAMLFTKMHQLDQAMMYVERGIAKRPKWFEAYFMAGMILSQQGEDDQAMEYYQKAIEINPFHAPTYYNIGFIYEEQLKKNKAEQAFKKAYAIWNKKISNYPDYLSKYPDIEAPYQGVKRYLAQRNILF